ncbi:unnamed protein product [Amoebophrya sp. A25]|nr:unnamed protein product [Amoebophrya sp. A25]|eukprot:GSA25T00002282001.1
MASSSSSAVSANALRIGRNSANRVIFGHGLGDSPRGWADVCAYWSRELPNVQFVLPAAPMRPVTLNGGAEMPAWYDLPAHSELAKYSSRLEMNVNGIEDALAMYSEHVVDPESTVFAGFSQGAAVALYTGMCAAIVSKAKGKKSVPRGILALSGYLPAAKALMAVAESLQKDRATTPEVPLAATVAQKVCNCSHVPVLLCHGRQDEMVSYWNAEKTQIFLREEFEINAELLSYDMGHEACQKEVDAVAKWLHDRFPKHDEKFLDEHGARM